MRATKKTKLESSFFLLKYTFFFLGMFFLSPEINCFFGNRQQSDARAGQKKTHVFFGNALPKSDARAHLKQKIET